MSKDPKKVLEMRAVSAAVNSIQLLHNITLFVNASEFVTVIGRNGAGKSSLLKACFRAVRLSCGEILLCGETLSKLSQAQIAERIAYVPQGLDLLAPLSVSEFVRISCYPFFNAKRKRIDDRLILEALGRLNMRAYFERAISSLSGGERQRVLLAAALVGRPAIVMLDEPTTYLDPAAQAELFGALSVLRAEIGCAILMVSHHLTAAQRISDRIVALLDGRVVGDGKPGEILSPAMLANIYGCPFSGLSPLTTD